MEKKPNKTWAIVGTIAAILLCGCPGLGFCIGGIAVLAGLPVTTWFTGIDTSPKNTTWLGVAGLCISVIFIAIAIVLPVLLLRKKKDGSKAVAAEVLPPQEPLPPAS